MIETQKSSPSGVSRSRADATAYRADIDGLRAVSVLAIIVHHLERSALPGGFVGVDVFFVISGFLVTRKVVEAQRRGAFSFFDFYLGRVRRLAPAFFLMATTTLAAGFILLLPGDMIRLAESAIWATFSLANVFAWARTDEGYFAASSSEMPLLHTWSLGVEEQFYLLWPAALLLAGAARKPWARSVVLPAIVGVASFGCAEAFNISRQSFAYYMLPARAGELMIGAMLTFASDASKVDTLERRPFLVDLIAVVGFTMLAFSALTFHERTPFPGLLALVPCVGAAAVMFAGEYGSRIVARLLTPRPIVFLGLISYGLYLWHWPILAFIRYFHGTIEFGPGALAVVAILALATVSYRLVERPARRWRVQPSKQLGYCLVGPSAALIVAALGIFWTRGMENHVTSLPRYRETAAIEAGNTPMYRQRQACLMPVADAHSMDDDHCVIGSEEGTTGKEDSGVLLWGDSHAAHYVPIVSQVAARAGLRVRTASHPTCPPVFGGEYGAGKYRVGCGDFRSLVEKVISSGRFHTVLIGASWGSYYGQPSFRTDLERTLRELNELKIEILILGQTPYFPDYHRMCDLRGLRLGGIDCRGRRESKHLRRSDANKYLEQLAAARPLRHYFDVWGILCPNGKCSPYLDDQPVYFDGAHLSETGGRLIGRKILDLADREPNQLVAVLNRVGSRQNAADSADRSPP